MNDKQGRCNMQESTPESTASDILFVAQGDKSPRPTKRAAASERDHLMNLAEAVEYFADEGWTEVRLRDLHRAFFPFRPPFTTDPIDRALALENLFKPIDASVSIEGSAAAVCLGLIDRVLDAMDNIFSGPQFSQTYVKEITESLDNARMSLVELTGEAVTEPQEIVQVKPANGCKAAGSDSTETSSHTTPTSAADRGSDDELIGPFVRRYAELYKALGGACDAMDVVQEMRGTADGVLESQIVEAIKTAKDLAGQQVLRLIDDLSNRKDSQNER